MTSTREMVVRAMENGYGVPAINVVDDLSLEAVLAAAERERSPIIVQTSVKTVRSLGASVIAALWRERTRDLTVPAALHLDHCPDREVVTLCIENGWDSVLFDGSSLPADENLFHTREVVIEAHRVGVDVEGELDAISGVEDGVGSDRVATAEPVEASLAFIAETSIDIFAPAVGTAHGHYRSAPELDLDRVSTLAATGVPLALHGGSGLDEKQFRDLIARGCGKVNISTALKERYLQTAADYLEGARARDTWDPPALFAACREAIITMTADHIRMFGSGGRA